MSLAAAAGAGEGGGGERRRRRPRPAHHSLHLILGRCALRKARASRSRRRRQGGSCCSHRRHHVLPRQKEHPADHGESDARTPPWLARSWPAAPRMGAAWIPPASLGWYPGRDGGPGPGRGGGVWRAVVSPAGAAGRQPDRATLGFGENQTKRKPKQWRGELWIIYLPSPPPGSFQITQGSRPSLDPRAAWVVSVCCPRRGMFFVEGSFWRGGVWRDDTFPQGYLVARPRPSLSSSPVAPRPHPPTLPSRDGDGMPGHPSSPWPLLACIHPSSYFGASYSDSTANVALVRMTNFFFALDVFTFFLSFLPLIPRKS